MGQIEEALSRLWALVTASDWASPSALRESVSRTSTLVSRLRNGEAPRAFQDAVLLGRALERIGRGRWPTSSQTRLFLVDCIRAIALRLEITPFWDAEVLERLQAPTSPTEEATPIPDSGEKLAVDEEHVSAPDSDPAAAPTDSPPETPAPESVPPPESGTLSDPETAGSPPPTPPRESPTSRTTARAPEEPPVDPEQLLLLVVGTDD